ncbi:MAG: acetylglutamate kinase, partial [Bacteroidota bacterium]
AGFTPVVATVCADRGGALYNVNADTVAMEIAVAMGASELVLVAEAGGVYRDYPDLGSRIDTLTPEAIEAGVREGWIAGGMRPKLEVAREAIRRGIPAVRVAAPADLAGGTRIAPDLP